MENKNTQVQSLLRITRNQTMLIRLLVVINLGLLVGFSIGAARPISDANKPVESLVFKGKDDTHWRISTVKNALCFETKTKNTRQVSDDRKWHKVAQLYADQIHNRHAVRFDVGDFADSEKTGFHLGVASMGIETNRGISSPYFSAIRAKSAKPIKKPGGFPFTYPISHATLGFGGPAPPRAGIGGDVHGNRSFSPNLYLVEAETWSAKLHRKGLSAPSLDLKAKGKRASFSALDEDEDNK